jgi:hypothetical protein
LEGIVVPKLAYIIEDIPPSFENKTASVRTRELVILKPPVRAKKVLIANCIDKIGELRLSIRTIKGNIGN